MSEPLEMKEHIRRLEKVRDVALARDHYSAILCDALLAEIQRLDAIERVSPVTMVDGSPMPRWMCRIEDRIEKLEAMEPLLRATPWEPRKPEAPGIEAARTALLEYAGDTDCDPESMAAFADGLIATCRRLEHVGDAARYSMFDVDVFDTPVELNIRRAGQIEALEWALEHAVTNYSTCVRNAITRLKQGGDL